MHNQTLAEVIDLVRSLNSIADLKARVIAVALQGEVACFIKQKVVAIAFVAFTTTIKDINQEEHQVIVSNCSYFACIMENSAASNCRLVHIVSLDMLVATFNLLLEHSIIPRMELIALLVKLMVGSFLVVVLAREESFLLEVGTVLMEEETILVERNSRIPLAKACFIRILLASDYTVVEQSFLVARNLPNLDCGLVLSAKKSDYSKLLR